MATEPMYRIEVRTGQSMSLSDMRSCDIVYAVIIAQDGTVAATTASRLWRWHADERTVKMQGGKLRAQFERYYQRTGRRWEVEQKNKRDAERAEKRAQAAKAQAVRDAAPELLAALRDLLDTVERGDPIGPAKRAAIAAVAKAEGR